MWQRFWPRHTLRFQAFRCQERDARSCLRVFAPSLLVAQHPLLHILPLYHADPTTHSVGAGTGINTSKSEIPNTYRMNVHFTTN